MFFVRLAVGALIFLSGFPPSARAAEPVDPTLAWSVSPAPAKDANRAAQRPVFNYTVDPGETIKDSIRINNYSEKKLVLQLYTQDAMNTLRGGFDLLSRDEVSAGVGKWVSLAKDSVTLAPRSQVDIPLQLNIPHSATPGDHTGGIVAALFDPETPTGVRVERRVGTRMYLRVSGELKTSAEITDLTAQYQEKLNPLVPGSLKLTFDLQNTGNTRISGTPKMLTENSFGQQMIVVDPAPVADLLPGERITIELSQPRLRPTGWLTVRPQFATSEKTISATSKRIWAIPWGGLIALLFSALAIRALVLRRRKEGTS